jgi:hypothetical protein
MRTLHVGLRVEDLERSIPTVTGSSWSSGPLVMPTDSPTPTSPDKRHPSPTAFDESPH